MSSVSKASGYHRLVMGLSLGLSAVALSLSGQALADAPTPVAEGFAALPTLASDELTALRGREGFKDLVSVQSVQNMEAAVSDASFTAGTITTGGITVESRAMDNFSGIGQFNMLTGNGNAVNTGVSISIFMPVQTP